MKKTTGGINCNIKVTKPGNEMKENGAIGNLISSTHVYIIDRAKTK